MMLEPLSKNEEKNIGIIIETLDSVRMEITSADYIAAHDHRRILEITDAITTLSAQTSAAIKIKGACRTAIIDRLIKDSAMLLSETQPNHEKKRPPSD